mmetsp:Transcript_17753/g.38913  ORF Transcript_17753/g.38913 Transcript_17753/m.38913 type:complete len:147 (+) Transcript_17753:217-657(+)
MPLTEEAATVGAAVGKAALEPTAFGVVSVAGTALVAGAAGALAGALGCAGMLTDGVSAGAIVGAGDIPATVALGCGASAGDGAGEGPTEWVGVFPARGETSPPNVESSQLLFDSVRARAGVLVASAAVPPLPLSATGRFLQPLACF